MKTTTEPELVIFDLGNVVFRIDWQPMFDSWSNASGVTSSELERKFQFDENFEAFERGQISAATFHQRLCNALGAEFSYDQFVTGWNAIYQEPVAEVQLSLVQLQGKLQIVAFTNTNEVHCQVWPELYKDVLTNFEHIFTSSDMGVRKPEAEGFKRVLETCGVEAAKAIFFDDLQRNVDAANELGLVGVLVDSPDVVSKELIRLGLLSQSND